MKIFLGSIEIQHVMTCAGVSALVVVGAWAFITYRFRRTPRRNANGDKTHIMPGTFWGTFIRSNGWMDSRGTSTQGIADKESAAREGGETSVFLPPAVVEWPETPSPGNGISEDWAEFVSSRLEELKPGAITDETGWALGVIDFLDELGEAGEEASPEEKTATVALRKTLGRLLADKGFSSLDSDEWNPDIQRAVAVVRKADATGTKILGKGATGLSRHGKTIRKQEVKIEMKGS